MMSPKISIVVTVYNQKKYIIDCLESIKKQTYADFECIIIEDGSDDSSEEVVRNFIKEDTRFSYEYKCNGGVSSARNYAINKAKGTWILIVDGDDWIVEQTLEWAIPHLLPCNHLVYSTKTCFFKDGQFIPLEYKKYELKSFLLNNCFVIGSFFKKLDWEKCLGFDESMHDGLEDWEFYINLISINSSGIIYNLDREYYICRYLESSRNRSIWNNSNKGVMILDYIYNKHYKIYNLQFGGFLINQIQKERSEVELATYKALINKNIISRLLFKIMKFI